MGSGGMVVMDEDTCMVDVAHFFLSFTQAESCGKCTPCRIGTKRMLNTLSKIRSGQGETSDLEELRRLAEIIKKTSLCGLGKTAPNPILTTLKYFEEEYKAHILEKRCPAVVCKNLIQYVVLKEKCTKCGACTRGCPAGAIEDKVIDQSRCIKCGRCYQACPVGAIQKRSPGVKSG